MALYSALLMLGKGAAKNPGLSFGGQGEHDFMNKYDPIGSWITGWGGDPLNLYGQKDNPNALLFPSSPTDLSMAPPPPGLGGGGAGMTPHQNLAMLNAYQEFLNNVGAPPMRMPQQPGATPPVRGPVGGDRGGVGGGGYRGPAPGGGGLNYGGLMDLSRFGNGQMPTLPIANARY